MVVPSSYIPNSIPNSAFFRRSVISVSSLLSSTWMVLGRSPEQFVRLALQEMVDEAGLKMKMLRLRDEEV